MEQGAKVVNRLSSETNSTKDEIHSIALNVIDFCRENRDHYQELDMVVEANVFNAYVKRLSEDFGISLPSPPTSAWA